MVEFRDGKLAPTVTTSMLTGHSTPMQADQTSQHDDGKEFTHGIFEKFPVPG